MPRKSEPIIPWFRPWRRGGASLVLWACLGLLPTLAWTQAPSGGEAGPTVRLDYNPDGSGSSMADFMYFIPLISPEPVTAMSAPGSTQQARVTSVTRKKSGGSLTTTCDFEFSGDGSQQDVFDLTRIIQAHERKLKEGGTVAKQLRSITVNGSGHGRIEVKASLENGAPMVTQVRLRFNAEGHSSPVSIELCDLRYRDGEFLKSNELVARVNSLTFKRQNGTPRMEVSVASVKNKGAGNGIFQNLAAGLKGAAANMVLEPLRIEPLGNKTMLEFGDALLAGARSFTFPRAKNLVAAQP